MVGLCVVYAHTERAQNTEENQNTRSVSYEAGFKIIQCVHTKILSKNDVDDGDESERKMC